LQPRETSGKLFYAAEYFHVFEKYWDYLPNLEQHPDFESETPFSQDQMKGFSSALSEMDFSEFMPSISAEAEQSDIETAEEAAISRLRPIQDGLDFWGDWSSPATRSCAAAPDRVHTMF
jgi:hypothetical protein